jgi:hypothetical protein
MKYRKKPIVIEAHRWWRNGDHPLDGPADREGQMVRYYRMPPLNEAGEVDVNGELNGRKRHCDLPYNSRPTECQALMHDHGWIDTLEGGHTVCPGDWIITGVQGERYPVKPDIFEATYEPVDGDS